jgi:hypothetical protein
MEKMKTFSITIEETLYNLITKDSLTGHISKSEVVKRRLVENYYSTTIQEEKVVKRFDEFEQNVYDRLETMENKMVNIMTKDIMYSITNFHYMKMLTME